MKERHWCQMFLLMAKKKKKIHESSGYNLWRVTSDRGFWLTIHTDKKKKALSSLTRKYFPTLYWKSMRRTGAYFHGAFELKGISLGRLHGIKKNVVEKVIWGWRRSVHDSIAVCFHISAERNQIILLAFLLKLTAAASFFKAMKALGRRDLFFLS